MSIEEILNSIKLLCRHSPENFINPANSTERIISFLTKWHGEIPCELGIYLASVDGGRLRYPLFEAYERVDFIGSAGTGDLISHSGIIEIITRKFSSKSAYKRTASMASDHDLNQTVPIVYIGDGGTIDYRPIDGKAYLYDEVVASSLKDLLIKQCLMPDFFRDLEYRCHERLYEFDWISAETEAERSLQAFTQCLQGNAGGQPSW